MNQRDVPAEPAAFQSAELFKSLHFRSHVRDKPQPVGGIRALENPDCFVRLRECGVPGRAERLITMMALQAYLSCERFCRHSRLLRPRRDRPCNGRTAERLEKFAPPHISNPSYRSGESIAPCERHVCFEAERGSLRGNLAVFAMSAAGPLYPYTHRESGHSGTAVRCQEETFRCYSITSSARASSVSGTVRPSALAVLRLITSSYLVGAWTGKSVGFSPRRMRPT